MAVSGQPAGSLSRYNIHWHVVLIHLPISFFMATALFAFLYLVIPHPCFDLALLISLAIGFLGMIPVIITGWFTWKGRYKGFRGLLFKRKILTSFTMLAISLILLAVHVLSNLLFHFGGDIIWRAVYFIAAMLLAVGAGIEGYYGGRLNHK